jgi:hypothetical protein
MTAQRPDYNYFGIALGGIAVLIGLTLVYEAIPEADREGPVYCDGEEMHPGDVCTVLGGGSVDISAKNYEDMAAEQLAGHGWLVWLLCLGILVSVGAVIVTSLYVGYVRSSAKRTS